MLKKYRHSFFCFSPPVMIATFAIEILFAVYILWRYKFNQLTRLVVLLLVFLALFQLAEFMICEGYGFNSIEWARIGYFAITLLPALGVHILYQIMGYKKNWIVWTAYATMLPFVIYFVFASAPFYGQECLGNYVIFQIPQFVVWLYATYYYGWIAFAMITAWQWAKRARSKKVRRGLQLFSLAYVAFLLPTITVNLLQPETLSGIPSIMCGFAILFVIIVTLGVMPLVAKKRGN